MKAPLKRSLNRGFHPNEDNVEPDHGASLFRVTKGKPDNPASGLERGPDPLAPAPPKRSAPKYPYKYKFKQKGRRPPPPSGEGGYHNQPV